MHPAAFMPAKNNAPPVRAWRLWLCAMLAAVWLAAAGCSPSPPPADDGGSPDAQVQAGAATPTDAVLVPTRMLRENRLHAFAKTSVPPQLQARVEAAWREGRTCWPLDELPFGQRIPQLLHTLAAPGAEARLRQGYDLQFGGADAELQAAARALTLFGMQYLQREHGFSQQQRAHYPQLIQAMGQWAGEAGLGRADAAHAAIRDLTGAARRTGMHSPADFRRLGQHASLERLGDFTAVLKQILRGYGLDVDADLAAMQVDTTAVQSERATVRMRYRLHQRPIEALVDVQRIDGRWYIADLVRNAQAAAQAELPATGGCSA